jgi:hypothetical protein
VKYKVGNFLSNPSSSPKLGTATAVTTQKSSAAAIAVSLVVAVIWGMGGKVENFLN